ncbi:hypothetical protein [Pseudomonas luteola]|uniref:Phage holin family protein n=1 Tax=Pseudomonas luteola TaxID=47886 RepID=A0ABS0MZG7_PSELU|nr:hypothetical protein [Pseudomonas luteola]MBH3441423.1 hypothetical protein [Pseudomonas luteola]
MEESAKAQPFGKRVAAMCIYATVYYAVLALVIGFGSEVFARAVCALWVLAVVGPGLTLSRLFTIWQAFIVSIGVVLVPALILLYFAFEIRDYTAGFESSLGLTVAAAAFLLILSEALKWLVGTATGVTLSTFSRVYHEGNQS